MPTFIPFEYPSTADGKYRVVIRDDRILFTRREQLGLTQQQVADMAKIPLRQYQRIESGQSPLGSNKMEFGLAICAVLLLDPYELICPHAEQANPNSLKPLPAFDIKIPDELINKKVGRKPIRRDIMRVYMNAPEYSMIIPCEVLAALGKPRFIQIRQKKDEHRILILPILDETEENIQNEEGVDVPQSVYEEQFLGIPGKDFIEFIAEGLNWGKKQYSVESRLVKGTNGMIGILIDLNTAKVSESLICDPVVPRCFIDDEDVDDEENDE